MKSVYGFIVVGALTVWHVAVGAIPDSRYQYAADGEYGDLIVLPWESKHIGTPNITFRCPTCAENQPMSANYAGSTLFNGVIKLATGNVVGGFVLSQFNNTAEFQTEMDRILSATESEIGSPAFVKSIASLAGRKDVIEIGMTKVGGYNAFYSTTRMERRIGSDVVYRGVQRVYLIPLRNRKRIVSAGYCLGVLGADEIPYSDFKAFLPVGEKFVKSITLTEKSAWKFW